jgi:2-polyprenyl-3-methyl-5-hydroxy-6-metoxy-1,4-benzoquinol methylase
MTTKTSFIAQERWDQGYEKLALQVSPPEDPIRRWLEQHIPRGRGTCLEFGCFPGRYLAVLGELGYEVSGIDLTPRLERDLPDWMRAQGYRTGDFIQADVFTHPFEKSYDVVCSFGLIEHFAQWPELVERHAKLVRPGGWLALSTPNFRGALQQRLHRWLDSVNLAEHNLEAMQPRLWAQLVRRLGLEVVMCGYIGPFDFWVGSQQRTALQQTSLKVILRLKRIGRLLPDDVGAYAPYCGLIARKPMV